ncbi:MAG: DUF2461 domain-containing protein [Bryobacterales bacterium]|nr:DUF2461 domain-containing protein [Bryobacterales bacterium]
MPATPFSGFPPEALTFFRQLKRNNKREWFEAHKPTFEEKVRVPMVALVEALNTELAALAPEHVTEPKKAIYRLYRDTRFSKDKTPYKDHIAANFPHRRLDKHAGAGLYVGISHESVDVAGGLYMPGPEQLLTVRSALADRHGEFTKLASGRAFTTLLGELQGDQLTRVPKGFPADHPAADLLRRKQWYWYVRLEADLATSPKLFSEIRKRMAAVLPAVAWLNAPLLALEKKESDRARFAR